MDEDNNINAAVGLRFKPSDPLLIAYLYNKVSNNEVKMPNGMIEDHDLYGQEEPWEIWDRFGGHNLRPGEDLYFFTTLKKKTSTGSRINRSVGSGTWKGEDSGTPIRHPPCTQIVGCRKRFRYEDGLAQQVGRWIMHEYSIDASLVSNPDYLHCVLCRLRKNERGSKSLM